MRESELLEGNRFVRGIKKVQDRLFAIVRLYDQLRPAHVTLAVAWRQTLLLSLDLSRLGKASLNPLSRFWGPAAIEWPSFYATLHGAHDSTMFTPMSGRVFEGVYQIWRLVG